MVILITKMHMAKFKIMQKCMNLKYHPFSSNSQSLSPKATILVSQESQGTLCTYMYLSMYLYITCFLFHTNRTCHKDFCTYHFSFVYRRAFFFLILRVYLSKNLFESGGSEPEVVHSANRSSGRDFYGEKVEAKLSNN